MRQLAIPALWIASLLLAGFIGIHFFTEDSDANSSPRPAGSPREDLYGPRLEHDPPVPRPPSAAVRDFRAFVERLQDASENSADSLVLHKDTLDHAGQVFLNTKGVPDDIRMEMHSPFFMVDPEAIFALYFDLPTLERGFGLFQQNCSQCHGPYGRGNGPATLQWYAGNFPRNFSYAKFKSRSTEYGTVPTDKDLYRTITRGLYGSSMPSFRHLSDQDRWSLVQFVKSLANFYDDFDEVVVNRFDAKASSPPMLLEVGDEPPVTIDTVTRGRVLFIEQACAKCHQGAKSRPIGLARWEGAFANWNDEMGRPIQHSRDLTTPVYRSGAAASDLFRIISGGPTIGPMPSYQSLPEPDRWALVHYVQSTFKPDFPQAPPSADALANPPKVGEELGTTTSVK